MAAKAHLALLLGASVFIAFGIAAAADVPRSIWGENNPGRGGEHAAMPEAGALHNHAGANHPTGGGDDENESDDENETGDHEDETDDDDLNETEEDHGNAGANHDENETDEDDEVPEEGTPETLGGTADMSAGGALMYHPMSTASSG